MVKKRLKIVKIGEILLKIGEILLKITLFVISLQFSYKIILYLVESPSRFYVFYCSF